MIKRIAGIILTGSIMLFHLSAQDQQQMSLSAEEIESYRKQVNHLTKFLEETLNFIGDPANPVQEKEIIFNESYSKIFLNDKVQVEDDLDSDRDYPIYKDVQAYLKDIDFFFREAEFDFEVMETEHFVNDQGNHFFKVSLNRRLQAVGIDGDTINNRMTRYIEVNLDLAGNDIKIASIYTHKFNEREEIRKWWNELSIAWKEYFGAEKSIGDTIRLADVIYLGDSTIAISGANTLNGQYYSNDTLRLLLPGISEEIIPDPDTIKADPGIIINAFKGILATTEIDISGNLAIRGLEPVTELSGLRVINFSNTLIKSLYPLRNLNNLEAVHCSGCPVRDLTPLQYASRLVELQIDQTLVTDLSPLQNLKNLKKLNCSGTRIVELKPLSLLPSLNRLVCDSLEIYHLSSFQELTGLEHLSIAHTYVRDLGPLHDLTKLRHLDCSNTLINSLDPLGRIKELQVLFINNTGIRFLYELDSLENLRKIYCNNTLVNRQEAMRYMKINPECLVVYETEELKKVWDRMDETWKEIFMDRTGIGSNPDEDELHELLKIEELDVSNNENIDDLDPLRKLYNLEVLDISGTRAADFTPLSELFKLKHLDVSHTTFVDPGALALLTELETLNISNTGISTLQPVDNLEPKVIYADTTGIDDKEALSYRASHPSCLIVYKTSNLRRWWSGLPEPWKNAFRGSVTEMERQEPSREELHRILFTTSVRITDSKEINDLRPLLIISGLTEIVLQGTSVSDLTPVASFRNLLKFVINRSPVRNLEPLKDLTLLQELSIENTPVSDLDPIAGLENLTYLNCSGTDVSKLNAVEKLGRLRVIEFSNTSIKRLKPLYELPELEKIICFNTRVSTRRLDKFMEERPGVEVVFY